MIYTKYKHLYNTQRWQKQSKLFRQLNPNCVYCEQAGRQSKADVVDHIQAHKGDEQLFWDTDNWQSLCKTCHDSAKKKEEIHGRKIGCDDKGYPLNGW